MQRRNVLRTLTALAAATTLPLAAWEAAQHHTDRLTDADPDEWEAIVADYAIIYNQLPPDELIKQLTVDLTALQDTLATKPDIDLYRTAAQMSGVLALALSPLTNSYSPDAGGAPAAATPTTQATSRPAPGSMT